MRHYTQKQHTIITLIQTYIQVSIQDIHDLCTVDAGAVSHRSGTQKRHSGEMVAMEINVQTVKVSFLISPVMSFFYAVWIKSGG